MKNLCSLLLLLLTVTLNVSAQIEDQKAHAKVIELQKAGIDTIITYMPYCFGSFRPYDKAKCTPYNIEYVFWQSKGINYIQRFDECFTYQPIANKSPAVFKLISLHAADIIKEKIKKVKYAAKNNGRTENFSVSIDHSCHLIFGFYFGLKRISKDIDDFKIETAFVNDFNDAKIKYPNLNYNYNQHTYLNQLKNLVEQETATLYPSKVE